MAVITPPLFQTIDSVYTGASLGLPYRDIVSEGVAGSTDLAVSQRGAGANMSVDVAAGVAWIKGDDSALQPVYRCYNDGTVNLTVTAADATNPRIDLVIAEVRDAAFSGVSTDWRLRVVAGTPAGSPSAPATPSNSIVLARLSVPALDTTIGTAQITDYRPRAGLYSSLGVPTVTSLPTQPYDGQVVDYLADATDGTVWRLKYRSASASAYKWEFVGGSPLTEAVATSQSRTSATYGTLTTVGPELVNPLPGDYRVSLAARAIAPSGQLAQMSYTIGGAAALDTDAMHVGGSASTVDATVSRDGNLKTLATSSLISTVYRTSGGATGTWSDRRLSIIPVRVSA